MYYFYKVCITEVKTPSSVEALVGPKGERVSALGDTANSGTLEETVGGGGNPKTSTDGASTENFFYYFFRMHSPEREPIFTLSKMGYCPPRFAVVSHETESVFDMQDVSLSDKMTDGSNTAVI